MIRFPLGIVLCLFAAGCGSGEQGKEVRAERKEAEKTAPPSKIEKSAPTVPLVKKKVSDEPPRERADEGGKPVKEEKKEERVSVSGVDLPKGLPLDVPLYAGGRVTAGVVDKAGAFRIVMTTSDKLPRVVAYFTGQIRDKGWKQTGKKSDETMTTLSAEKGGRLLTIQATEDEAETEILIVAK